MKAIEKIKIFFFTIVSVLLLIRASSAGEEGSSYLELIQANATIAKQQGEIPAPQTTLTKPFIILIQDIHSHPEAQLRIQKIIQDSEKTFGPFEVLVEGGEGPFESSFFRANPNADIVRSVLTPFLTRGELSGTELASVDPSIISRFQGMEHSTLYRENRLLMLRGMKLTVELGNRLESLKKFLDLKAAEALSPRMVLWQAEREKWEGGRVTALDYLKFLMKEFPEVKASLADCKQLSQLTDSAETWTEDLVLKAQEERRSLIREIGLRNEGRRGAFSDEELMDEALRLGFEKERLVHLKQKTKLEARLSSLSGLEIFEEFKKLETFVVKTALTRPEDRKLWGYFTKLGVISRLIHFALARDEAEEVLRRSGEFRIEVFEGELAKEFADFKPTSPLLIKDPEKVFIDFYRCALNREKIFKTKINQALSSDSKPLLVVAGGFHAPGLLKHLDSKDWAYLTIIPRAQEVIDEKLYWSVMAGGDLSYWRLPTAPKALALASALVFTYTSNPVGFRKFHWFTGQEIYDSLMLHHGEDNVEAYLEKWRAQVGLDVLDPERLQFFNRIFFQMFLRTLELKGEAHGWDADSEKFKNELFEASKALNNLFLIQGNERFKPRETMGGFLQGIQGLAQDPRANAGDILLLTHAARAGITLEDMRDIFVSFVRGGAWDEKILERYGTQGLPDKLAAFLKTTRREDLYEIVADYYYLEVIGNSAANSAIHEIIRVWRDSGKTTGEFLNEAPMRSIHDPDFYLGVYLATTLYPPEKTFEDIGDGFSEPSAIYGDKVAPAIVPQKGKTVTLGNGRLVFNLIDDPRELSVERRVMVQKLNDVFHGLVAQYEPKYRKFPIKTDTAADFEKSLAGLRDMTVIQRIIAEVLNSRLLPLAVADHAALQAEYREAAEQVEKEPSLELADRYRLIKQRKAEEDIRAAAMAKGIEPSQFPPNFQGGWRYETMMENYLLRMRKLAELARTIERKDSFEAFGLIRRWVSAARENAELLRDYLTAQNRTANYSLHLISDPEFDRRWPAGSSYVTIPTNSFMLAPRELGAILGIRARQPSTYEQVDINSGAANIYFLVEYLDRYQKLKLIDPVGWEKTAIADMTGILREEIEHLYPLGEPDLWLPDQVALSNHLEVLLKGFGYDEREVTLKLRLGAVTPIERAPRALLAGVRPFVNYDEAIAKFMRGGGSLEALIDHYAHHLYVMFALDKESVREWNYLTTIKDYLRVYYNEMPWLYLKLPADATREGKLKEYAGKTLYDAMLSEATKVYRGWEEAKGKSLGASEEPDALGLIEAELPDAVKARILFERRAEFLKLNPESLIGETAPQDRIGEISKVLAAWLEGRLMLEDVERELAIPEAVSSGLRDALKQAYPERFEAEKKIHSRESFQNDTAAFLKKYSFLQGEAAGLAPEVRASLERTVFAATLRSFASQAARPAAVYFLPHERPVTVNEFESIVSRSLSGQHVTFYEVEKDSIRFEKKLSALKKELIRRGMDMDQKITLNKMKFERPATFQDMRLDLLASLERAVRKGEGAVIFGRDEALNQSLPSSVRALYILLQGKIEGFDWLSEKIREIGFILPVMSNEEAEKFSKELEGYGIAFRQTERGIFVEIVDLAALLEKISQEYQAVRAQAVAA